MPKLSNMLGETGTIEIPVPHDEPLVVTYRRAAMTPRRQGKMVEAQRLLKDPSAMAEGDALLLLCDVYAGLIESWNLTDDAGAPIGTTADALADVDLGVLTLIADAIGKAVTPDPLSNGGSSNGSSQRGSSEPPRIGMAS